MRIIRPDFRCPRCSSAISKVTDEGGAWGISECLNIDCGYWIDVYDLVHRKGQKVREEL
jgi:hypothetical protein